MDFAARLRAFMDKRGMGVRALARAVPCDPALISRLASGKQQPSREIARRLDDVLESGGELAELASRPSSTLALVPRSAADDEIAALELARRAAASDVGPAVVERLEVAVDELAVAYPSTPPAELLARVRTYLDYTSRLIGVRATLRERQRLLVTGGWLSLLAATCLIDLHRDQAAVAHLRTAAQLARETGHAELAAWCLETRAWQVLTGGDYQRAAQLSQAGQRLAPRGSSAHIQATAQEGRAWARLKDAARTRDALTRVERLVAPLPMPDTPEHHYRYDPPKAEVYVATTLSWLGDTAAEPLSRQVLTAIEAPGIRPRPRRAALARLDLALALTVGDKHDEAAGVALEAIRSGRLAPVDGKRAREVIHAVTERGVPEAAELDEAYREACGKSSGGARP